MRYTKSKKKCVRKPRARKNQRKIKSVKRGQRGGGGLSSIMSMVPFMPKMDNSAVNTQVSEQQDNQNSQNVLVGALCNQFVKNNIKGTNTTTYDGVLDNLCSNQQVGLPARLNTVYTSNSVPISSQNNNNNNNIEQKEEKQNNEGFQVPSFLSGVKGIANIYSKPLRMGINAIQGLTSSKKPSSEKEKHTKEKHSKKKRLKKKKSKKKKHRKQTLEEDILQAEREISEERKNEKSKILQNIKNGLGNNIEVSKSIKK